MGGRFKLVWNVFELRRSVYKMFGIAVFTDAGNVFDKAGDFRFKNIRVTPGAGLRASTPIGIIRLDYGVNADKRANETQDKIYFSMGHAF